MPCNDCKKTAKLERCEVHNPKHARICRDCCIVKMKGQECKWYGLCWPSKIP